MSMIYIESSMVYLMTSTGPVYFSCAIMLFYRRALVWMISYVIVRTVHTYLVKATQFINFSVISWWSIFWW